MLGGCRVDSSGTEQQEMAGCCVCGNEALGYINLFTISASQQELCFMESVRMRYNATRCQQRG
jgi:hypothetical protein